MSSSDTGETARNRVRYFLSSSLKWSDLQFWRDRCLLLPVWLWASLQEREPWVHEYGEI